MRECWSSMCGDMGLMPGTPQKYSLSTVQCDLHDYLCSLLQNNLSQNTETPPSPSLRLLKTTIDFVRVILRTSHTWWSRIGFAYILLLRLRTYSLSCVYVRAWRLSTTRDLRNELRLGSKFLHPPSHLLVSIILFYPSIPSLLIHAPWR